MTTTAQAQYIETLTFAAIRKIGVASDTEAVEWITTNMTGADINTEMRAAKWAQTLFVAWRTDNDIHGAEAITARYPEFVASLVALFPASLDALTTREASALIDNLKTI
jgi:hypothetical protein